MENSTFLASDYEKEQIDAIKKYCECILAEI